MTWEDTTPRSQQDPDKTASCWTLQTPKLTITVLNSHRHDPGEWVIHCSDLAISTKRIGIPPTYTPEQAQAAAVEMVKKELRAMVESLAE